MVAIGIAPQAFFKLLSLPLGQFLAANPDSLLASHSGAFQTVNNIGYFSMGFILLAGLIFIVRQKVKSSATVATKSTWGCAYVIPNARMQYTASSFVRSYRKLAEPLLSLQKFKKEVSGVFPGKAGHQFHPQDKVEELFIVWPLLKFRYFISRFSWTDHALVKAPALRV